jgi:hypothetical protein
VPAVTFIPSESFAFANCLASLSVGNDFVCLNRRCPRGNGSLLFRCIDRNEPSIDENCMSGHDGRCEAIEDIEQCHKRSLAAVIQIKRAQIGR